MPNVLPQSGSEVLLATLPGSNETERLVVILALDAAGGNRLSLRQQTWGEGVGWYNQSCVEIEPQQINLLRAALGPMQTNAGVRARTAAPKPAPAWLRLHSAESA